MMNICKSVCLPAYCLPCISQWHKVFPSPCALASDILMILPVRTVAQSAARGQVMIPFCISAVTDVNGCSIPAMDWRHEREQE